MVKILKYSKSKSLLKILFVLCFPVFSAVIFSGENEIYADGMSVEKFTHIASDCSTTVGDWPEECHRTWVGPDLWANRLQDWQIRTGRLECLQNKTDMPMRTVHLLTREISTRKGTVYLSVRTGTLKSNNRQGWSGFLIGAGGGNLDYRSASLTHHSPGDSGGLMAVIDMEGNLSFRGNDSKEGNYSYPEMPCKRASDSKIISRNLTEDIQINLEIVPAEKNRYNLKFSAWNYITGEFIAGAVLEDCPEEKISGNIALVSSPFQSSAKGNPGLGSSFWFRDLKISGSKVKVNENRICGPILSTQHTLHKNILKMTAQMMPLGQTDTQKAKLQIRKEGQWKTAATTKIIIPGFTATFRVENWDSSKDTPYRVVYDMKRADSSTKTYTWSGNIRHDPVDKPEIIVAAFTGNHNVRHWGVEQAPFPWTAEGIWFPHSDLTNHVARHNVDVLFFSGDQVYETASPTRADMEHPYLDYLYKWYLWCWAFRDLCRDIPVVIIPDDHDMFQGNIWGSGGRHAERFDDGGYTMPPEWIKMVERTQTSHLPDPYDPTPVEQGIGVYYTAMNYGGVSFAIIEDRKFKSSATVMIPDARVVNGFFNNPDFDPETQSDVPGAKLLGDRQLNFLHNWTEDWSNGVWMKVVLSQTIFAKIETLPKAVLNNDQMVRNIKQLTSDEYPPDDIPVPDTDSNGWPQTGRNNALREMRRGFALHIAGDQHLGSTIQYGVDDWDDAAFALCVPSVANFWPRRWYPSLPGRNKKPGMPRYTGEYKDPFGNRITVHAVSNPVITDRHPISLYDKAPGYGIVKFNRNDHTITIECWPRWEDPSKPGAKQYPGWPITISQTDNYNRKPAAYLPTINVSGITEPVVQVIDEKDGKIVYTLRIKGTSFRPKVFRNGAYTLKVGEPGTERMRTLHGIRSIAPEKSKTIEINF